MLYEDEQRSTYASMSTILPLCRLGIVAMPMPYLTETYMSRRSLHPFIDSVLGNGRRFWCWYSWMARRKTNEFDQMSERLVLHDNHATPSLGSHMHMRVCSVPRPRVRLQWYM